MNSISVKDVGKYYGRKNETVALDKISLEVSAGSIFGLIGPDGAGKTSLFRILTTLLLPDAGEASVQGFDVVKDYKEIRKIVGYMPGKFSLYQDLSVRENLHFFATLFKTTIEANYELIRDIYSQLEPFNNRRAGALSGGMKQKLALCCALVHKPEVLFLDEPTTGVDAVSRKEFWAMLKRLKQQGITIFVSTPYMDEATMCDRIALIQGGKIMSINTPYGLLEEYSSPLWGVRADNMYQTYLDVLQYPAVSQCHTFGAYHHVRLREGAAAEGLESYLQTKGHSEIEIKIISPTVEDRFIDLMQTENKYLI
ncbi:MAG: ABC transporter ATP-binding protein [Saprospiraceae bacterium]|nr:ABC transporter ATP-binding protein [Saprospiraceae bacterium]